MTDCYPGWSFNRVLLSVGALVELTAMALLPSGVSWLLTLLLWACICFLPQRGSGYSLNGDEFSSHPQTSDRFHSGAASNTNHDSVSPRDEMRPLQREPVYHDTSEDASSVTSHEEMGQSKPALEHDAPPALPVLKYERGGSGSQHPFSLLVKEHNKEQTMEGTTFPTIRDLKRFIETMKRSFLMPGSDFSRHFQTARETMEHEMASKAQNVKGERDTSYRSNSAKEGSAHDDAAEAEVWSEAMNAAFEQSEQDANYQMPNAVDSTAGLLSTTVYDGQDSDSGPGSALYPRRHLAATEQLSRNYGSFDSDGISGENTDVFISSPHVHTEHVQSTDFTLPEQTPSGSFFGEDLSFGGHVTASPVNPPNSPSQDFSYYYSKTSDITPLNSENIQQPTHPPHRTDSLTGDELGNAFQSEELSRVTPANVPSAPMPPSLNSYGKSVYVRAPRGQHYIPDYLPTRRERPAQSFQAYQATVAEESTGINSTPTTNLPVPAASLSSSSDDPSPQSHSGHVGAQTSSPHDAHNQVFNRKQPVRLHTMFTVNPSSSPPGSSRHDGYLRDQTASISRPSTPTARDEDEERSDLSEQNLISATQGSKQMADDTLIPVSSGLDSTQSGISSQVGDGDVNFNSLTNLNPTSASERDFSRLAGSEVMSRNFGMKNIISDVRGARKPLGSFSTALRRGIYRPPEPPSASKGTAPTLRGVFWKNTVRLPPQTGPNMSPPSVNAYVVKGRNGYVRSQASLSKTRYAPYQLDGSHSAVPRHVQRLEVQ